MTTPVRTWLVFLCFGAASLTRLAGQVTESPFTLPPGKFLLEIDALKFSYDRSDVAGHKYTGIAVASTILSTGLTQSLDLQVGADVYLKQTFELGGARDSTSGLGDMYFRAKWTFWRDDKRGAALAILPYVKVPTGTGRVSNDEVEGGFILPWAMDVAGGVKAGAMLQWDVVRNHDNNGYDAHWHLSGFAQRNITKALAVYGELTTMFASTGFSDWGGTVGVGALLQVTQNVQLDYEMQRGLNRRATDWTHVFRVNWEW